MLVANPKHQLCTHFKKDQVDIQDSQKHHTQPPSSPAQNQNLQTLPTY
jgi:hypothetical protein